MKAALLALWLSLHPAAAPVTVTPTHCRANCTTSVAGQKFIQEMEGFVPFIYKDAAGLDTIGFGHLVVAGETFPEPLLPDDAAALMKKDLARIERGMARIIAQPLKQPQFDALASFTYNLGVGALASSTLLKKVNAAKHAEVSAQFARWVYAGRPPRVLVGLKRRRALEAALYDS